MGLPFIHLALQHPCNHDCSSLARCEYRRTPDISPRACHQNRLARLDSRCRKELVARYRHQRERRRLDQIEPLRDLRQDRRTDDTKFSVGIVRHREDLIADGKPFHGRPSPDYGSRHVDTYEARKVEGKRILR